VLIVTGSPQLCHDRPLADGEPRSQGSKPDQKRDGQQFLTRRPPRLRQYCPNSKHFPVRFGTRRIS
jgi:hypothetical protein